MLGPQMLRSSTKPNHTQVVVSATNALKFEVGSTPERCCVAVNTAESGKGSIGWWRSAIRCLGSVGEESKSVKRTIIERPAQHSVPDLVKQRLTGKGAPLLYPRTSQLDAVRLSTIFYAIQTAVYAELNVLYTDTFSSQS